MARSLAFILLISLSLQLPPASELLRLPALFEHFMEHLQEHPDLSLIDFISLHYNSGSAHHHESHDQLPFKSISFAPLSLLMIFSLDHISFIIPELFTFHHFPSPFGLGLPTGSPSGVWQPPRLS
jgi:hypothetical protein